MKHAPIQSHSGTMTPYFNLKLNVITTLHKRSYLVKMPIVIIDNKHSNEKVGEVYELKTKKIKGTTFWENENEIGVTVPNI